jgi:hypothetical protein
MSPHLVVWLLGVAIVLGVGLLLGRLIRRRQREHMQRLKNELRAEIGRKIKGKVSAGWLGPYSSTRRRRRALAITETELRLIAALAIIGLSRSWTNG